MWGGLGGGGRPSAFAWRSRPSSPYLCRRFAVFGEFSAFSLLCVCRALGTLLAASWCYFENAYRQEESISVRCVSNRADLTDGACVC